MNDLTEFRLQIKKLFSAFPNQLVEQQTIAVYTEMLADIPVEQLAVAVRQLVSTAKFLPTIAEIRTAVAGLINPDLPNAAIAWGEVRSYLPHIMKGDACQIPKLSNPIAQKVADSIGWRRLYFYQSYCEKLFISAYNESLDRQKSYALLPADVRQFKENQALKQLCSSVETELENSQETTFTED